MHFKGNRVEVSDNNASYITLTLPDGSKEEYSYIFPNLVIGNIMVGGKYIEA